MTHILHAPAHVFDAFMKKEEIQGGAARSFFTKRLCSSSAQTRQGRNGALLRPCNDKEQLP
jgi:hypothetical protein